ncbi:MAG: hypothetical protein ACYCW6_10830 [Candidatus Xenobia bacterium]
MPTRARNSEQSSSIGDRVEHLAERVAGLSLGVVAGVAGALYNGCAGGAEGAVHGAQISGHRKRWFQAITAVNLAAMGAIAGGVQGAIYTLVGGIGGWLGESPAMRNQVLSTADQWVDQALSATTGQPGPTPPSGQARHASVGEVARRAWDGLVGDVVGASAGAYIGATAGFAAGSQFGQAMVAHVADGLR